MVAPFVNLATAVVLSHIPSLCHFFYYAHFNIYRAYFLSDMRKMSGKQYRADEATGSTNQKGLTGSDDTCHCSGAEAAKWRHAHKGNGKEAHDPCNVSPSGGESWRVCLMNL